MRKYVIMGIQGSGKGTHAKMLAGDFDLEHIAVGDIFRWNVQHHTKLGAQVRRTMAAKPLTIAYGSAELPAMIESSRAFHRRRSEAHVPGDLVPIPNANHFTILDHFLDPASHLVKTTRMLSAY